MKRWVLNLAALAILFAGPGQAYANFILNFDENGNATLNNNGTGFVPLPGTLVADPREGGVSLTYFLPNLVGAGDVLIDELGGAAVTISDMLRFTNANGSLTGTADRMIYYSDLEPNEVQGGPGTDLADRIFHPVNPIAILEVGPEGNNGFQYGVPNTTDNVYNGISDRAQIPEPATLMLLGIGIAGMAGYRWRRRKTATA